MADLEIEKIQLALAECIKAKRLNNTPLAQHWCVHLVHLLGFSEIFDIDGLSDINPEM